MTTSWLNSRGVTERVFIRGTLMLETPAHLGNGDAEGLTDIPLLRDPVDGRPLLTGASIAGALRNYLREVQLGYGKNEARNGATLAEQIFGHLLEDEASVQSWLIVDDVLGTQAGIELRDSVSIQPTTRTARAGKKFDVELLAAGTTFDLSFELLLTEKNAGLLGALAVALEGFQQGKIGLGYRKRRGFGQCRVSVWTIRRYKVTTPAGLIGWLTDDSSQAETTTDIVQFLGAQQALPDARQALILSAIFKLDSSVLIRSGSGSGSAPDMVHLRSRRGADTVPILSGTSLAGAIRARALRIANTMAPAGGATLVESMFGKYIADNQDQPTGSRVLVKEAVIKQALQPELVQSRVKIDRFTGGAYPQALFSEQPLFATGDTTAAIILELRNPQPAEVGLLLMVLKDLWTGDLALGGESSVGRGRLSGVRADLVYAGKSWVFEQKDDRVDVTGELDDLNVCVKALKEVQ